MRTDCLRPCAACRCPMVAQRTWDTASHEQRTCWKAAGLGMLKGRGLCATCYMRARDRGEIPPREPATTALCVRCGQATTSALCVDCTDVAIDLRELARWAS